MKGIAGLLSNSRVSPRIGAVGCRRLTNARIKLNLDLRGLPGYDGHLLRLALDGVLCYPRDNLEFIGARRQIDLEPALLICRNFGDD